MPVVISAEHVGKKYLLRHQAAPQPYVALRDVIAETARDFGRRLMRPFFSTKDAQDRDCDEFWALKDVSFEVREGERIGIIGRNGAGKSTLLKVLSRITEPTSGEIMIEGRVASLLEVGTGFHPELTGRENIFLNGAILGMRRSEIRRKFDEIVAFAEIERFLDTPVKRYSSGMYVRLAFSVAAHLDPEILFVDEVLAVGDAQFQKKCLGKMDEVSRLGRTIVFVSHNMGAIRNLCDTVMLLDNGMVHRRGSPDDIIKEYLTVNVPHRGYWRRTELKKDQAGIYFEEVVISDGLKSRSANIASSSPVGIKIRVFVSDLIRNTQIAVRITNQEGIPVFTTTNCDTSKTLSQLAAGYHTYYVQIPADFLLPGQYQVLIASMVPGDRLFDVVQDQLLFVIEDTGSHATIMHDGRIGVIAPLLEWKEIV